MSDKNHIRDLALFTVLRNLSQSEFKKLIIETQQALLKEKISISIKELYEKTWWATYLLQNPEIVQKEALILKNDASAINGTNIFVDIVSDFFPSCCSIMKTTKGKELTQMDVKDNFKADEKGEKVMNKKFLFCNVAYMEYYVGHEFEKETPHGAGKFVKENGTGMEEYNFINYDGKCYGFVQNPGQFNLERLAPTAKNESSVSGVTIVWCARQKNGKTVIVGWYENATLLRYGENMTNATGMGIDNWYYVCHTNAEDAYLLDEANRTFVVPRAAEAGKGKGFGQQNYWYADSEWGQNEFIPQVKKFMEAHRNDTINAIPHDFLDGFYSNELVEKTYEEILPYKTFDYLPLAYRMFNNKPDANIAYDIGKELERCFQFSMAITWFNKIISLDGESYDILYELALNYCQLNKFDEAMSYIKKAQNTDTYKENRECQADVDAFKSNIFWYTDNDEDAIKYIDMAIDKTQDADKKKDLLRAKEERLEIIKNNK